MEIYSNEADALLFTAPYDAKRLLDDSMERTKKGFHEIGKCSFLNGCGNILLARIESVAAGVLVIISQILIAPGAIVIAPLFLVSATILNLGSRLPGISSYESIKKFTNASSDAIYRTLKIQLIALPVIFLFLTTSSLNAVLPIMTKTDNFFSQSIHSIVKSLGPLQKIRVIVPGITEVVGTETEISILSSIEDYFRALSSQNYLKEVKVSSLTHHYSYTRTFTTT